MTLTRRLIRYFLTLGFSLLAMSVMALAVAYLYIGPQLPNIEQLQDVQYSVPLRVYTHDGLLMAEFGEQRRRPVHYEELPERAIQAILAIEDDRFFEHPGIDYHGLIRAALDVIRTGKKRQGGSTITMQVARNFFLSREKTYLRKLKEIFLALKIEKSLSKQEILELYLNKIYFGQRAYGIGAAARVYYGIPLNELSLEQIAMIAGLPKAPSANNPVSNPKRAIQRRNYVLKRMYILNKIDSETYLAAVKQEDNASIHAATIDIQAPYVAEMVRNELVKRYGEEVYRLGYTVTTTIDSRLQQAANQATVSALLAYDRRHGYRGVERQVDLGTETSEVDWEAALEDSESVGGLLPGLVVRVEGQTARVFMHDFGVVDLDWDALSWAKSYKEVNQQGKSPKTAAEIIKPGDVIRLESLPEARWRLARVPEVEGALVSLRPADGAVMALTGGFNFFNSKFNRAVQAMRQPGSSFKPFIYSAALEKGYTAASIFNDAPVVFEDPSLETTWRPENYSGKFYGPTRMRVALIKSRNLVSVRLLRAIGAKYAAKYAMRFGFPAEQIHKDLSLVLGSSSASPMQMARGFSVFANGGYLVDPYFIESIADSEGEILFTAEPRIACKDCVQAVKLDAANTTDDRVGQKLDDSDEAKPHYAHQAIKPAAAYLITSMLRDAVKRGTGKRAMSLGRNDLAGKTGTTNDQRDAWFCGYNADLVTTVWVGFDQVEQLGNGETGSRAALPMWIEFMGAALKDVPEKELVQPEGMVTVRIDPETGLLVPEGSLAGIEEMFFEENVPVKYSETFSAGVEPAIPGQEAEPLF
ncbi:MAG: penicillin-binding protein 1A [Gammaproteobacteria bacterium]